MKVPLEIVRLLKGSASLHNFAAKRLRVLGEAHNATILTRHQQEIEQYLMANVWVIQPEEIQSYLDRERE